MAVPFRIGVMQLTMEPLEEMLESARVMDAVGMDTIWLAEAYPWWRKHGMEARSSTVVSALMARETTRLTIGWGIVSPYTRHPVDHDAGVRPLHARQRRGRRGAGGAVGGRRRSRLHDRRVDRRGPRRGARRRA